MSFYQKYGKRACDIAVGVASLPIVAASTLVCGALIKLDDGGPIFYNAQRRGKDGHPFLMYKFRTMTANAPAQRAEDHSFVTTASDSRITKVGRILRAASIDEIPQLRKVLRGDMSLIGPRPDMAGRPWEQLSEDEQHRLAVRPGVTGYTQAFYRNSISAAEKYALDCEYVDNITVAGDLAIVKQTILSVLGRQHIYDSPAEHQAAGTTVTTHGEETP